jgi:glycosyltransferase involved in cell wall biosynthesis
VPATVTVIIPTYNWSSVLPYAIGSVLRQTFRDFELLVVGDGCTDDSADVVASIGDPRVHWINLPHNTRHQSGPNNAGLAEARGEIVAYLGHDDLWLPHHLESHLRAFDANGADLAYSLCLLVAADGSFFPAIPRPRDGSFSPPSGMTHRRSVTDALGGWRSYESVNVAPEVELWRRARAAGRRFAFVQRLTAIKFPALWRPDVYRTRSCHEQKQWSARIGQEPDLEAKLLAELVVREDVPNGLAYRDLLRLVAKQTIGRIRRRLSIPRFARRAGHIELDELRRMKGLP